MHTPTGPHFLQIFSISPAGEFAEVLTSKFLKELMYCESDTVYTI